MSFSCPHCGATCESADDFCQSCWTGLSQPYAAGASQPPPLSRLAPLSPEPPTCSQPAVVRGQEEWVAVPKHRGELLFDHSIPLSGASLLVGRFDASTGPVDIDLGSLPGGETVHRNHAKLEAVEGGWKVSELNPGRGNGVFVRPRGQERFSSRLSEPRVLGDGDEVSFGQATVVLKWRGDGC